MEWPSLSDLLDPLTTESSESPTNEATRFDGGRFRDIVRRQFHRPWMSRMKEGVYYPPQVQPDLERMFHPTDDLQLTWLGHSAFLVQMEGMNILTDPVLSRGVGVVIRRHGHIPLRVSRLPKIDAVVISHSHYDHLNLPTLRRIGPEPHYFVPKGLRDWMQDRGFPNVTELDWWERKHLGPLRLEFVPSRHWSHRAPWEHCKARWGGWVIQGHSRSVYFAGDSAYFDGFKEIGRHFPGLDAALLPIGAYQPRILGRRAHMNPTEALKAYLDLGANWFVPMHWGTFRLSDEPMGLPPEELGLLWSIYRLPPETLKMLAIGETTGK